MSYLNCRMAFGALAGLLGFALTGSAVSESGIDSLPNRTYVHEASKVVIRVPKDWRIHVPYRLRKSTTSSILGLEMGKEKDNPHLAVTILWSPLGARPFSDFIRASDEENLGEEYAMLLTVYGKSKISRPTTVKLGAFTFYKITIDDGPDREGNNVGAEYLFEAGSGENRWKVKIRAVYPQLNREEYMRQVEELISNLAIYSGQ